MSVQHLDEVRALLDSLPGNKKSPLWDSPDSITVNAYSGGEDNWELQRDFGLADAADPVSETVRSVFALASWPGNLQLKDEFGDVEVFVGAADAFEYAGEETVTLIPFAHDLTTQYYWCLDARETQPDALTLRVYGVDHDGSSYTRCAANLGEFLRAWKDGIHPRFT